MREIFSRHAVGELPRENCLWAQCARRRRSARRRLEREHVERQSRPRHGRPEQRKLHRPAVWNRLTYVKDPETGKRRSRVNASNAIVAVETPDLAIAPGELWEAVKARQAALGQGRITLGAENGKTPFWSKQRPRYLFSGGHAVCGGFL